MFWTIAAAFATACVAQVALGVSSAIAAPQAYISLFKATGARQVGFALWDLAVVGSIGLGIPAFVASLAALRLSRPTLLNAVVFIVATLLFADVLLPWLQNGNWSRVASTFTLRSWWRYGVELALVIGTFAALMAVRRRG